jgi:hypothetical protein
MTGMGSRGVWATMLIVAGVTAAASAVGRAEVPPHELVMIQRDVRTVLARESTATGFADRQAAVHELLALHERTVQDPRLPASPALQAIQRRVAGRLARVQRSLGGEAARVGPVAVRSGVAVASPGAAGGRVAEAQALIDLIQATVRPETWEANGGQGRITYFANVHGLVVLAPEDVHDDLGSLIRQLR